MKFSLTEKLFMGKKQKILITGSLSKNTHESGPAGVGLSKSRSSVGTPAKFSGVAKFLDEALVKKSINALSGEDSIYGECTIDENVYRFIYRNNTVEYDGERLHGFNGIIPVVLYCLKNDSLHTELVDTFNSIKSDYAKFLDAKAKKDDDEIRNYETNLFKNVLLFCDSFYFDIAKKVPDIEVIENDLSLKTVKAAVRAGALKPFNILNDVPDIPTLTGVEAIKAEKEKKAKKKASENDLFNDIRTGKKIINYEWNEEQKSRIAPLSFLDEFIPSEMFYDSLNQITYELNNVMLRMDGGFTGEDAIGQNCVNFFLIGKPGTGKTTMAKALSASTGMPLYSVPVQKNSEEDTFQGMTKAAGGTLKFVNTDFLNAFKNGGIILLEEINLADPAVIMGAIGQATEAPYYILEDGYKMIKRHPLCVIIGAFNVGTAGSKEINDALSSRFSPTYQISDPSKNDFVKTLMKTDCDKKTASWVYNVYNSVIDYLKKPSINAEDAALSVTFRACRGIVKSLRWGIEPKKAVKYNIIGKIAEKNLELADDVYNNVVASMPDLV